MTALFGRYEGDPRVELLNDGRRVRLVEPFAYVDSTRRAWNVPKDAIVDGASIPRALWTVIGGPFEGKYRSASIIHDWYCDLRSRPWRDVHRMFFEAMLASTVPMAYARLLYAGVYWGGPRWTQTQVDNAETFAQYLQDSRPGSPMVHYPWPAETPTPAAYRTTRTRRHHFELTAEDLAMLEREVETSQDGIEHIEALVERHLVGRADQTDDAR